MNKERLLKIIEDMQECKVDIDECIDILERYNDNEIRSFRSLNEAFNRSELAIN